MSKEQAQPPAHHPKPVLRLQANLDGHDWYTTDTHGQFTALHQLMNHAGFDTTKDRLLHGGDLIDRGPESAYALQWLMKKWLIALQGNHEVMVLMSLESTFGKDFHCRFGGLWFHEEGFDQQPYVSVFEGLPLAIEVPIGDKMVGLVHGDCVGTDWAKFIHMLEHPELPGASDYIEVCQWTKSRVQNQWDSRIDNIDLVIVGHTNVMEPGFYGPNVLAMDTGCSKVVCDDGREKEATISMLNLHTRKLYWMNLTTRLIEERDIELPI